MQEAEKAKEGELIIQRLKQELTNDSNKLGELNPKIIKLKEEIQ